MAYLKLVKNETREEYIARRRMLQEERSKPGASAEGFRYEGQEIPDRSGMNILISASTGVGLTLFFFFGIYFLT